jgi:hypothetical protein
MGIWDDFTDAVGDAWDYTKGAIGGDPLGDQAAADKQVEAQNQALQQQITEAQRARDFFNEQSQQGIEAISRGAGQGEDALRQGFGEAGARLESGYQDTVGALGQGRSSAQYELGQGFDQAQEQLAYGTQQARQDLNQLRGLQDYGAAATQSVGTQDVVGQRGGRLSEMLDREGGLYGGFESDPGYQYRLQQSEDAIGRAAAARGGRMSGRTLEALQQNAQGLASQEFANYAGRQNTQAGFAGSEDQSLNALLQGQAGRQQAADLAAQGNQMGLAGIGYGAQGDLAGIASQYGQSAAGLSAQEGLTSAGIEEQSGQDLGSAAANYGQQNAQLAQGQGTSLADLYMNRGSNIANTLIGAGSNNTSISQGLQGAFANNAQYGGLAEQAAANTKREVAGGLLAAFSDSRLKQDIKTLDASPFDSIGIRGVRWTWNDKAEGLGLFGESKGVLAEEVLEKYPDAVTRGDDGWLRVNYAMLLGMAEAA